VDTALSFFSLSGTILYLCNRKPIDFSGLSCCLKVNLYRKLSWNIKMNIEVS